MKLFDADSADPTLKEALRKPNLIISKSKAYADDDNYEPDDYDDENQV